MDFKVHITRRLTKRHGTAYDLFYRWKGVRYRPLLGYNLSDEEARRRAIEVIQKIQTGQCDLQTGTSTLFTLQEATQLYWGAFQAKNRVDETRPRRIIEQYLLPHFGNRPLSALTAEDGLAYVIRRQHQHAAPGTIRREFQVLMRILNLCVAYDKLDKNRLKAVDLPEGLKRTRVVTNEELLALEKKSPTELWRIILVALNTGLRESKVLELDRNWVRRAEDGYWLHLPPPRTRIKGHPKSLPLNRIGLSAMAMDVSSLADGRIFRRWTNIRSFRKAWTVACERAKIVDLHFHDLRHTFTTRLQGLGVDYEVRQALLGHKMLGMTAHYSHGGIEWDGKLRRAVTALEKAFLSYGLSYGFEGEEAGQRKLLISGEPRAARTLDPRLKRAMLYQLS